jgi:hypothetical protein
MLSSQEIPTLNSQDMGWLAVRLLTLILLANHLYNAH